jgi:hypothetical protein
MSENITVETDASVTAFLDSIENPRRRADGHELLRLMERVTGATPRMWGDAIVGFGRYRYRYATGREGDWMRIGFSPRKANLALYGIAWEAADAGLLDRLGKHRTGVSCLYVNRLADIDGAVLEVLVADSWEGSLRRHPDPA